MAKILRSPINTAALKNVIAGWFGIDGSGSYSASVGALSAGNVAVNDQSALKLAAVWACVRLISETIASMPLGVYQRQPDGSTRYAPEHPLHNVIHEQPNPDAVASVMWESFIAAMLLPGNAFCEKLMIAGRVVGLRFLAPHRLYVVRDMPTGKRRYHYTYDDGVQREIPADRIWRVPGFTLDGDWGVSSIHYGANVFGGAIAADTAAAKTYEKGLMPTTAFQYPGVLQGKARDDAREYILGQSGVLNSGNPVILERDMTVQQIGINPKDAQLLEARQYSREEICSWFRVPPWMVGYGEKSTAWGTGMEQQMIGFVTFVLRPWLVRIEQYAKLGLLTAQDRGRGYYVHFSLDALLRGDSAARAAFYDRMIKAAVMTPDEARELEEWPAMGGNAGKLMINSATVLLDQIGAANVAAQTTPREPAAPDA
jgi:HK97 family phage portal protein